MQTGPFSASTNPTFDIAPTNTKKFYMGILNPIGKDYFAHVLAEGRVTSTPLPAFYLLVDGIDEVGADGRIIATYKSGTGRFFNFVDRWEDTRIVKLAASGKDTLGPAVKADAKAIVDANAAGLEIRSAAPGMMQLARKTSGTLLCFRLGGSYADVAIEENAIGKPPPGDPTGVGSVTSASPCAALNARPGTPATARYRLHMRSVEEVLYFLGRLQQPGGDRNWVLEGGCSRSPFLIYDHPVPRARFSVRYRDGIYYVANHGSRSTTTAGRRTWSRRSWRRSSRSRRRPCRRWTSHSWNIAVTDVVTPDTIGFDDLSSLKTDEVVRSTVKQR